MWFCVEVVALGFAVFIVLRAWLDFSATPTFTTLSSQQSPIWVVPFPGIAICNVNKLSRTKSREYAKYL